jgi:GLPGLI family protein
MKKSISLLLILISFISFAQKKETKGLVYYGEIESIDRGAKNGLNMLSTLVFNKTKSCYTTKKDSLNSLSREETKDFYKLSSGGRPVFGSGIPSNEEGYQVYTDLGKDSVWSSFQRVDYYYVKEKKQNINWKLEKETKTIGTYNCNKATAVFRGREYIAWYTLEIPVPFGPWKLQGLPGLILEAYTANEEIYFYTKKIEYPTENKLPIKAIKNINNSKWYNYKEYLVLTKELIQKTYDRMILLGFDPNEIIESKPVDDFKEYTE